MAVNENRVLGRGKIFFQPYAFNTRTSGILGYLGNTPTLTLTKNETKLDHFSSEGGLKIKDLSIVLQDDMMLAFETDNIDAANLALWFAGILNPTLPPDAPTNIGTVEFSAGNTAVYGALLFKSNNPIGTNRNFWFPFVNLTPTGNLSLKGDTWQQFGFSAECLKRDDTTDRMYSFAPANGASSAIGDTTPYLTPAAATLGSAPEATGGTVTNTGSHAATTNFTVTYTLTGGTYGYLFLHDNAGALVTGQGPFLVTGTSGTSPSIQAPASGTFTVRLHAAVDGSDTALATTSAITIS